MPFPYDACESLLRQGLKSLDITLDSDKITTLLAYLQEFHKWNQAYNLSAIRQPEAMVSRHLLDSLALVPYLQALVSTHLDSDSSAKPNLIDVGTGGGLPGLPLAIVFPDIPVTLLDSNGKKTRFLFQTAHKLQLNNVTVENNRVEKFSPEHKFAIVISRAFASLQAMIAGSGHLLANGGEYWAMKGLYPDTELADCAADAQLKAAHKLMVPDTEGERHLLILQPVPKGS